MLYLFHPLPVFPAVGPAIEGERQSRMGNLTTIAKHSSHHTSRRCMPSIVFAYILPRYNPIQRFTVGVGAA